MKKQLLNQSTQDVLRSKLVQSMRRVKRLYSHMCTKPAKVYGQGTKQYVHHICNMYPPEKWLVELEKRRTYPENTRLGKELQAGLERVRVNYDKLVEEAYNANI